MSYQPPLPITPRTPLSSTAIDELVADPARVRNLTPDTIADPFAQMSSRKRMGSGPPSRALASIPSLDSLCQSPELAAALPAAAVAVLLGRAHIASAALEARLLAVSVEQTPRIEPNQARESAPARLITAAQVSERLGFKPSYVYELARAGKLRGARVGKYVRFAESAIDDFIARNESSPLDTQPSNMLSRSRGARTTQKEPRRARMRSSRAGTAVGRSSNDPVEMGARLFDDSGSGRKTHPPVG